MVYAFVFLTFGTFGIQVYKIVFYWLVLLTGFEDINIKFLCMPHVTYIILQFLRSEVMHRCTS